MAEEMLELILHLKLKLFLLKFKMSSCNFEWFQFTVDASVMDGADSAIEPQVPWSIGELVELILNFNKSSTMDQKQLQAFATVKRTEKHLMFAKAKARKRENKNEIQQSECKTFHFFLSAIRCSRRAGCHGGPRG